MMNFTNDAQDLSFGKLSFDANEDVFNSIQFEHEQIDALLFESEKVQLVDDNRSGEANQPMGLFDQESFCQLSSHKSPSNNEDYEYFQGECYPLSCSAVDILLNSNFL
jgi:hypothetical protein